MLKVSLENINKLEILSLNIISLTYLLRLLQSDMDEKYINVEEIGFAI